VRSHVLQEYRPRRLELLPGLFNRIAGLLKARNRRTRAADHNHRFRVQSRGNGELSS
jgi:hypothetical protein